MRVLNYLAPLGCKKVNIFNFKKKKALPETHKKMDIETRNTFLQYIVKLCNVSLDPHTLRIFNNSCNAWSNTLHFLQSEMETPYRDGGRSKNLEGKL